ncbi:MAG: DNA recombination protein RmuC [Candidatus Colwellbacteria bacterium]|nr:DNA recombination protein RmuC [Candidatus Colwellbacteria bacterium]
MELIFFVVLTIVLIAGFGLIFWTLRGGKGEASAGNSLNLIQNQINELNRTLDSKLGESGKAMREQFSESAKIIRDVTEKLTRLDETNKQVVSFADQLRSLQDILKNPKQRGVLGEYYLETLLKNVLPPDIYKMQYAFKNGDIVDAVVFVGRKSDEKIIPIDSKFSLENYNRLVEAADKSEKDRLEKLFVNDLKNRIVETSKYIRPEEGTTDFAFMFIPHEAIYYDLLINKVGAVLEDTENLIQRAAGKYKVLIVSPTSFLAYLQTVLQGLRALKIEESAKEIRKRVEELGKHMSSYDTYMQKLGAHLGTSVNMYSNAYKEFKKIDKDVYRITGDKMNIEPLTVSGPDSAEDE